jgi:hypothetical protein
MDELTHRATLRVIVFGFIIVLGFTGSNIWYRLRSVAKLVRRVVLRLGKVTHLYPDPAMVRSRQQVMYDLPHRNRKDRQLCRKVFLASRLIAAVGSRWVQV